MPALRILAAGVLLGLGARGAELPEVAALFAHGEYARVVAEARAATKAPAGGEEWWLLLLASLGETGQYAEARQAADLALAANPASVRLRLAAYRALRAAGDPEHAASLLQEIDRMAARAWLYQEPADQVALGRAALLLGADAKLVLGRFFDRVKKSAPESRDVYLASADLALEKGDAALAAKEMGLAAKKFPGDAEISFRLAEALSEPEAVQGALAAALKANPHHAGALLLTAEHHLDADRFEAAEAALDELFRANPANPAAHALRAVLAELNGDPKRFAAERQAALKPWPRNPEVEHLIGRKLSQHYRFAEGSVHQRQALAFEPAFLLAKRQLAEDLLRLGEETEGWKLAAEVQAADPYDIVAYNLVTLQEKTSHFQALESEHFLVRMEPAEAEVYGRQVLALLESAHAHLCARYGFTPAKRTTVEIFPDPRDFAIRTFGLPGGSGYLGVCFGSVITANSPAARPGSFNNWQAVLWHEFAHVVTLGLTKNRMPRWLSEGISVYEERLAHGNWGEQMKPRYRAMILSEDYTPLSELSGAFLRPKTAAHLQFAYYESSLAVEYLTERFGLEALKAVCADLAAGRALNTALAKHCAPLAQLDQEFAGRARGLAQNTAPKLDWTPPRPEDLASPAALTKWTAAHPENYVALMEEAKALLAQRAWEGAKAPLRKLIELYPEQHEPESARALLARAHRELGETAEERAQLEQVVQLSGSAAEAQTRLLQLAAAGGEWSAVLSIAQALAAIDPLLPQLYRAEAEASAALHQPREAIAAYETLLKLDENVPPEIRLRLAQQYRATGQLPQAKRRLLESLEEAPRNREALKLLTELAGK